MSVKLSLYETIFSKLSTLSKTNGQLIVTRDNSSLYVDLDGIKGVVPRIEVSATVGRYGLPMPVASITKVNKKVQFKIKEIKTKTIV